MNKFYITPDMEKCMAVNMSGLLHKVHDIFKSHAFGTGYRNLFPDHQLQEEDILDFLRGKITIDGLLERIQERVNKYNAHYSDLSSEREHFEPDKFSDKEDFERQVGNEVSKLIDFYDYNISGKYLIAIFPDDGSDSLDSVIGFVLGNGEIVKNPAQALLFNTKDEVERYMFTKLNKKEFPSGCEFVILDTAEATRIARKMPKESTGKSKFRSLVEETMKQFKL